MYCARSLINVATCHGMSNSWFSFHLVTHKWHKVYPENTGMIFIDNYIEQLTMIPFQVLPSSSPSHQGEGTLIRHCEERSDGQLLSLIFYSSPLDKGRWFGIQLVSENQSP